ncbi:MAG: SUMF1/EgtB/PvdO family nonheme iron enzyme [Planctomycetota bacterium]
MLPRPDTAAPLFALLGLLLAPACRPSEAAPVDRSYTETIRGSEVRFDMVWIPNGGFWIGRTEVTWDEYLSYCAFDASGAAPPGVDAVTKPSKPLDWTPYDRNWGAGRRPAVGMSWNAAKKYCEWLSANTGHAYRLPSEAEWQLACGTGGAGELAERAWYSTTSGERTEEVGRKAPNEYGLHDMLGNLWEYCAGPWDPAEPERAVLRGGSWKETAKFQDPASRLAFEDDWTLEDPNFPPGVWWVPGGDHLGMRVLRPGSDAPSSPADPRAATATTK